MSDRIIQPARPLPLPQANVSIRPGVLADVPFLDSLQKLHRKQVGWMPTKQFQEKIRLGHVLIAESSAEYGVQSTEENSSKERPARRTEQDAGESHGSSPLRTPCSALGATPVGYCIGTDQYFKRDDVGIIYQLNVSPGRQRGFIGATLLRAMFERSAYGCRLFCCWCAQDIAANRFWEAMGFVPLAFRAGSEKKSRLHIFWQKRIRPDDTTTPWWFPSKTTGGSIREDRIVLPIPPGTHWGDAKPLILNHEPRPLPERKRAAKKPAAQPLTLRRNGLMFAIPAPAETAMIAAPKRVKKSSDARLVAVARELRDRWLERVNAGEYDVGAQGKYQIARSIEAGRREVEATRTAGLLAA